MEDCFKSGHWKAALKEDPRKAIKRFLDEGMIEQANLSNILNYKRTVSDLKAMLRQRGLPMSGRRRDLVARLVQADPEGMKKIIQGETILICSEKGRAIADKYLAFEDEKRARVEHQALEALRARKQREAIRLVESYHESDIAQQIFPSGLSVGVSVGDGEVFTESEFDNWDLDDLEGDLKIIFGSRPKILAPLSDEQLDQLRIAAGMWLLLGTKKPKHWLPAEFETGLTMDNDAAARMFVFHAEHQKNIARLRESLFFETVEILSANDSCEECQKLSQRKFRLDQVPELPYEKCTSKMGCRCLAIVEVPEV